MAKAKKKKATKKKTNKRLLTVSKTDMKLPRNPPELPEKPDTTEEEYPHVMSFLLKKRDHLEAELEYYIFWEQMFSGTANWADKKENSLLKKHFPKEHKDRNRGWTEQQEELARRMGDGY